MDGDRAYPCPARVFAGRLAELAALGDGLAAARAGEPQVVLIQGEAGIGKSSLISEFLGGHRGIQAVTVGGEETEAFLPYGLVQQLAAGTAAVSGRRAGQPGYALAGPARGRGSAIWFWLNIPLALLFVGCWAGIPLWFTLTRWNAETSARHAGIAAQAAPAPVLAPPDPRPFQDHDVRPRIVKGRSMDRAAHRVASVTSVRPNRRRAQMARLPVD